MIILTEDRTHFRVRLTFSNKTYYRNVKKESQQNTSSQIAYMYNTYDIYGDLADIVSQ